MKQKLLILLWLALAGAAFGQGPTAGPFSITSTQCAKISIGNSVATVGIQVTGSWTGTLQPEASIAGQAPANTQVVPSTSTTPQSTITANGVYRASVAALTTFLVCGNTVTAGTATVYLTASEAVNSNGPGGGGVGTVTSVTAGNGLNATTNPITSSGTISLLNPLDGVLTIDGVDHSSFGGANTTNMCTGLKYVNDNPAVFIYKVIDSLAYDSEAKDPWNDATCANGFNHVTGAMTYEFGTMNFIIGWGGTLHIPASAVFELGGRGSENQLSLSNGCGTTTPTQCTGTLFAAYQTASPFTGSFAMTCPGCSVMATGTPIMDYAGTGVSSSGTQLNGPGSVTCAGIGTSIGVQNTGAQENASIRDMTIVGCQTYALDVHLSTAQNFNMGPGIEILSGSKTGVTIGTPSTFIGVNWSVNGPNRDLGNVTCNTRGAATTTSIAACVAIVGPGGARMPTGRVHDIHTENVKIAVLVDGARNFKIENVNTGSATQDGSTPSTMVYICGAASAAPCATGLTSSKIKVEELAIISPSLMPNYIIDDTNTVTLTTSTWTNEYDTDAPRYGNPLTVAAGGTGDATLPAAGVLYGNGTNAVANITPPTANGYYSVGYNVTANAAVAPTASLLGVPTNAQTGTTYTVLYSDRAGYVSLSNAGAIAVTLPQANSTGFTTNFAFLACDIGAGTATITPTTSTISYTTGGNYTSGAASMPLTTGQCAYIYSDNTNYFAWRTTTFNGVDSGSGTAYVVSGTPVTALIDGAIGCFTPANANSSTTPTVAFNGLTAKTITKINNLPLALNDMLTTQPACMVYNGTTFYLLTSQGVTGSGKFVLQGAPSFTTGLTTGGLITDQTVGVTTAAMGSQTTATCTNITGMTWTIAANKNYRMSCNIPRTLAATATLSYCLGGPGTATSFSLDVQGANGAAGVWSDLNTLAQTAYGTKTTASAAAANTAVDIVYAQIQNGATASGTALTLQTAANGTNAITVLANASCTLTQEN